MLLKLNIWQYMFQIFGHTEKYYDQRFEAEAYPEKRKWWKTVFVNCNIVTWEYDI